MKKVQLLFLFLVVTGLSQAQDFGVHAGVNFANAKFDEEAAFGVDMDEKALVGPLIGLVANFKIADNFSFRPELNYIQKGFKRSYSEPGVGTAEFKARFNYIELPLNFAYSIPAGKHAVFIGAGPSIGMGLSGKLETSIKLDGEPEETDEEDIKFGSNEDEDDFKSLDIGLGFFGGFQANNGLFLKAGYNLGLSNISHDSESDLKNKGFAVTLGYFFKKQKAASN